LSSSSKDDAGVLRGAGNREVTRRGEIYWLNWGQGRGSEQRGVRPAVVVQNDVGNATSMTTIVAALSTGPRPEYPFTVMVRAEECGLDQDSTIHCEQLQTVDQQRL